jgi:hypothetical protein
LQWRRLSLAGLSLIKTGFVLPVMTQEIDIGFGLHNFPTVEERDLPIPHQGNTICLASASIG